MKLILAMLDIIALRIYIPHGSDETVQNLSGVVNVSAFISHMVQMKPNKVFETTCEQAKAFISHMVQMKHLSG